MQRYRDVVLNIRGEPVPGVSVLVKTFPGGVNASLFDDDSGTTLDNPLPTDSNGAFSFKAANGHYSLSFSGTGITAQTVSDITLCDPDDVITDALADLAEATGAAAVGFAPAGSIAATTVQAALVELDTEKASLAALATSAGSSLMGFIRAGTGAVARSMQSKLRDLETSTADFNILGDGSTETTRWQSAIDAISTAGGGILKAAPGMIYLTGKLTPKSNVLIDLNGSTLKLANSTNAPIMYDDGAGNGTRFGIINGTLDCNQTNNNGLNVLGGVWLTNWTYLRFEDLTITNCPRIGLNLHGVRYVTIRNYQFTDSGMVGSFFAYALSLEEGGGNRSRYVTIDGVNVSNVVGFGIHFFKCDDFTAKNLNFSTLTYSTSLAIAITFTEANRGEVANVNCSSVDGDNIEINDSTNVSLDNVDITAAGNRALLVGQNTSGNYNYRIKVSRFKASATVGSVSCALSACINCDFERLVMDKGANVDSALTSSGGNTIRDSSFGSTAANGLTSLGWFTLERVVFTDYTYRYLGKQRVSVSIATTIVNTTGVYTLEMTALLRGIFPLERSAVGTLRILNRYNASLNQGSFQKVDFLVNDFGTTANLGTVTTINNAVGRSLTIAGDAANKTITLTNATVVDLLVAIDIDFVTYR